MVRRMTQSLKDWRRRRNLTQAQAAELASVGQPSWAKWERGIVPAERCMAISELTGVNLYVLRPDVYPAPTRRASDKAGVQ